MARSTLKVLAVLTLTAASTSLLVGCSSGFGAHETPGAARWVCGWDPTLNDDWHDDYLCTNGTSSDRPRLIPDDSFVTRQEIDQAAAAYEAKLNS